MASDFEMVVRHTSWWRGNVHKWSTVYPYVSTAEGTSMTDAGLDIVATFDANMCFFGEANDQGAIYEVSFYSKSLGGSPLLSKTYADPENPGSGTLPPSAVWGSRALAVNQPLEAAMLVRWSGGLGRTGKPVEFKKYYHAVPVSTAHDGGTDILASDAIALNTLAQEFRGQLASFNLQLGNTRRLAGDSSIDGYYCNHQMPRGRRHKKLVTNIAKPGSYVVISPPSE